MNRISKIVVLGSAMIAAGLSGCGANNRVGGNGGGGGGGGGGGEKDLTLVFDPMDDGGSVENGDLIDTSDPDVCGDPHMEQGCFRVDNGPPGGQFPLQSDNLKDPTESDNGVNRDINGYLKLDSTHTVFNYLWIANASDLSGAGSAAKIDSKTVREVARYRTVTCFSLKTGSTQQCDGMNGCCSVDDWNRYQARVNKMPEPPHQAVQRTSNAPSRTSVDFNGDLYISNRAFGGQSSVTKIANDLSECIDRNHNGKIDTSSDTNGNGFIEVDCNGDGQPDTIDSVKMKPCSNNLKQEFFGEDDECILWTSNTFQTNGVGRPLGLAGGDSGASDAWAGSFTFGKFVRIDGISGKSKNDIQLPPECYANGTGPYGLAVDAAGIGWTADLWSGKLCYFDTKAPNNMKVGSVRDPQFGQCQGYGITMDRDQNVWVGGGNQRYTPDRSNGFNNLGKGWWTKISINSGIGIAADSRNAKDYFVYTCAGGGVVQIPASKIPVVKMDQTVAPNGWTTIVMGCYGVGVDSDQNVWGVDMSKSTRALVDNMGVVKQPVVGQPMGNNKCPAGDSCPNAGAYTYSDFTGFGLRNFTRPVGSYTMVIPGCVDKATGERTDTLWYSIVWDADVPPNTSLGVHASASNGATVKDAQWAGAPATPDAQTSPYELQGVLNPNLTPNDPVGTVVNDQYLKVEFIFKTSAQAASPKLKSFSVGFKCPGGIG